MRRKLLCSAAMGLCLAVGCAAPAMADSRKVVTLGADLTDDQKNTMMKYFGVDYSSVDVIYITNTDERNYLGSYVPLEQIGSHTYSCALVAPTTSGGIQVKTANLEWVTCNMIASTLSTSGVTNCQVVAASPFKVSGTGALTGVIMAYETASGETLSAEKVELANQELVTTGNLANEVGQSKATAVINETKIEVIENNVTNVEEITNIVNNVSTEYDVEISEDQSAEIAELMQQIAQQEYDITQLKATLDRVQANVAGDAGASEEEQKAAEEKAEASEQAALEAAAEEAESSGDAAAVSLEEQTESILDNTDPAALTDDGGTISEVDTTQTIQEQSEEAAQTETDGIGIPEATDDGTIQTEATEAADDGVVIVDGAETTETAAQSETTAETEAAVTVETQAEETTAETTAETAAETEAAFTEDMLSEKNKTVYDEVKIGLDNAFISTQITADDGSVVYLTDTAAAELPEKIEEYLLKIMVSGAQTVAAEEAADASLSQTIVEDTAAQAPDKAYEDETLKQADKYVRRVVFEDSENILADSMLEEADETILYNTIMEVLESAYGVTEETEAAAEETAAAESEAAVDEALAEAEAYAEEAADEFAGYEVEEAVY